MEPFQIARKIAYKIGSRPGCASDATPMPLPDGYAAAAQAAAATRLERTRVRLGAVLNGTFIA